MGGEGGDQFHGKLGGNGGRGDKGYGILGQRQCGKQSGGDNLALVNQRYRSYL